MNRECPICGRPLTLLEQVLSGQDAGYQCHNCWNRIHATGPVKPPGGAFLSHKPRLRGTRRVGETRERRS